MKFFSFVPFLLSAVLVSGMQFNTDVVKEEYKVGEDVEISIINEYDEDHWMVGIPAAEISLYDESATTKIFTIQDMIQLKAFPAFDKALTIQTWHIPEQIETEYKIGEKFSLVINYRQSIRGIAKPLSLSIDQPITIRGIRGTGSKSLPPAKPREDNIYPTDEEYSSVEVNSPEHKVQYSATWAYNMIKSLLVNHLL